MLSDTQQLTTSLDHCTHHTLHTCTCVTRPLATNIHTSDFRIAIQLTCPQHILHRYIHTPVMSIVMQLTYSLDGSKKSVNSFTSAVPSPLASMALWKVQCHRSNSSFCLSYREEGRQRGRRGEEGGGIRYVASKLAVVLMQQGQELGMTFAV